VSEPLPPGKYERRNGHPAWVIGTTPDGKGLVVCLRESGGDCRIHHLSGKWLAIDDHEYDLIAPRKASAVELTEGEGL
jgi:hypothetical protein